ncbi:hypothetical protein GALMADRAFT_458103 [Galerina marginata CBS 339.88]|uniref:Uncharacterized protein n=1 Tax=Galerina marginata (strain CBS 339.88) TaxID=685588 RepID=A0A067T131_GALM3|nr:hypothetical protein GALMADRAFT_458103 [Galerina marginata CBS 339.88]
MFLMARLLLAYSPFLLFVWDMIIFFMTCPVGALFNVYFSPFLITSLIASQHTHTIRPSFLNSLIARRLYLTCTKIILELGFTVPTRRRNEHPIPFSLIHYTHSLTHVENLLLSCRHDYIMNIPCGPYLGSCPYILSGVVLIKAHSCLFMIGFSCRLLGTASLSG